MSDKSIVICDPEEDYASALAGFISGKKEVSFGVASCCNIKQLKDLVKAQEVRVLLLNEVFDRKDFPKEIAEHIFIITEHRTAAEDGDRIFKYQSGDKILADMLGILAEEGSEEKFYVRRGQAGKFRVIGVFSPIGRSGKTGYALELGRKLAVSESVLYLSLELFGGRGGYFQEKGATLADALYLARQEHQNLGIILTTMVKQTGQLEYLLPVKVSEDLKAVKAEEWKHFLELLEAQSVYDAVILDLDPGLPGLYDILKLCTEIHVITMDDIQAEAKLKQFDDEIHLLGCDEIRRRIVRKESQL